MVAGATLVCEATKLAAGQSLEYHGEMKAFEPGLCLFPNRSNHFANAFYCDCIKTFYRTHRPHKNHRRLQITCDKYMYRFAKTEEAIDKFNSITPQQLPIQRRMP